MTPKKTRPAVQPEDSRDIDRIRDIILGPHVEGLQEQVEAAQGQLKSLRRSLDRLSARVADQDKAQAEKLKRLRSDMRRADREIRKEFREADQSLSTSQQDRAVLGELLVQLGSFFKEGGSLEDLVQPPGADEQD